MYEAERYDPLTDEEREAELDAWNPGCGRNEWRHDMEDEGIEIKLDIEDIDDPLYDALLETFRYKAKMMGLDPDAYRYGEWVVSCKAEDKV